MPSDATRLRLLGLLLDGSAWKLPELSGRLGISDATTTRLIEALGDQVLRVGERRGRRYLGRRKVRGIAQASVPVYRVLSSGASETFARLSPVGGSGYYCEFEDGGLAPKLYGDLPYFLAGQRPAGYLGRQIPERHPELENPSSIPHWSGDDVLRYLSHFGSDAPGDFIVGDEAFARYLDSLSHPPRPLARQERAAAYERLASEQLKYGVGSSAAGEQPKFLTTTEARGPVLVKFSPPKSQVLGRRVADLLVAEHLALETLRLAGLPAAASEIVSGRDAVFLEVARFDRTPKGRRGVVALGDLDAEFLGSKTSSWPNLAAELVQKKVLAAALLLPIRFLWAFGRLIANSDMHTWNLAFFTESLAPTALTPTYDMSPMLYSPRQGHVTTPDFLPPMPNPADGPIWQPAAQAASYFWERVAQSPHITGDFQAIARSNKRQVRKAAELAARLPK